MTDVHTISLTDKTVIKYNAPRIWDVGEMEYRLVAFMVNELPMEQLVDIEANSPVRLSFCR